MKNDNQLGHVKIIFVMIIFLFPLIAGSLLYHFRDHFHFKKLNHGTLVDPVIFVGDLWQNPKKWQIVYVPQNCVTPEDDKKLFLLHQLRLVLGNDSRRASLVLVIDKKCKKVDAHDFQKVMLNEKSFARIPQKNKIYLVDPESHLFMSYETSANLKDIYNDLKRVLEVSQIG